MQDKFDEIRHLINAMPLDEPIHLANAVEKLLEIVGRQSAEIKELREEVRSLRGWMHEQIFGSEGNP